MINHGTRADPWHTLEAGECFHGCPYLKIDLLVDKVVGYTQCFSPTLEEVMNYSTEVLYRVKIFILKMVYCVYSDEGILMRTQNIPSYY